MKISILFKNFFITCLVLLCLAPISEAKTQFPPAQGYVSDYAHILSPEAKSAIVNLLRELERKTQAEVAIVTIPGLDGEELNTYAVELFQTWGIGKKGKDNGLLLLIAMKERETRIEVGYGLEGVIPDGLAGEIIRTQITPYFKQKKYDSGLLLAASSVADTIAKDAGVVLEVPMARPHSPLARRKKRRSSGIGGLIFLILMIILFIKNPRLFALFMLGSMLGGRRRGGYWSGGGYGGGFSGGFGGFGGGMSGGGGASGGW